MLKGAGDETADSGAETGSDSSMMSSSASDLLLMNLHLLANPGDSLLLQQTLDRLIRWLCPSLRLLHVSERASPFGAPPRLSPAAGYPSLALTFFLHEAYGEERILKVLDFFQCPPWRYHHTEGRGKRTAGIHIASGGSPTDALMRPYLLPSRDFYSLGAGMPVWGVRPVHCGGEILRVTLFSSSDNYEDAVRFYQTVLQRRAEEQKTGFCWFTLHTEPGLSLQLAVKQLSPGVRVEPCSSAVLQFRVEEMGQLVPLLPNPCSPISSSRWQTEDLDGNKVLFQMKTPAHSLRPLTCAFPLSCPNTSSAGLQLRSPGGPGPGPGPGLPPCSTTPLNRQTQKPGHRLHSDPVLEKSRGGGGGAESLGSGSSCYSSQRSSPAPPSATHHPDSPLRPSLTRSLSHLFLEEEEEEEEEEEAETNVDTGVPVSLTQSDLPVRTMNRSASLDLLAGLRSEGPAAAGASAAEVLSLPRTHKHAGGPSKTWGYPNGAAGTGRTLAAGHSPNRGSVLEKLLPAHTHQQAPVDEFFI